MKIEESQNMEERYQEYLRDCIVGQNFNKKYFLDNSGRIEVDFNNMILKKPSSDRGIRRMFYPGFWMEMKSSPYQLQLHAKVRNFCNLKNKRCGNTIQC